VRRFVPLLLPIAFAVASTVSADIRTTKHNLSISGPGAVRAEEESRICIFCHTPHNASQTLGLLWNRADSTATYIPYESSTLQAVVGQPTGASKLCLSCHDGTVALGELVSEPEEVSFLFGVRFMPDREGLLGTDLSDDHPISFTYDAALVADNPHLADPLSLDGPVRLDPFGEMQCSSCHDPHESGYGKFLVASTRYSRLCTTCHQRVEWPVSAHAVSVAMWSGSLPDPWPHSEFETVAENGCMSCHRSHNAGSRERLLIHAAEEDNCLGCHNGQVASTDIASQITKPFRHSVQQAAEVHAPDEDPTLSMTRHVECEDCHDPHTAIDAPSVAPLAGGALMGATGVDSGGSFVEDVSYEYEVCFKCHGQFPMTDLPVTRQILQNDKRLQFDLAGPSYHPVEGPGANTEVPSLLPGYTPASVIYCSDCHASESSPAAGGGAPAGPHGSMYPYLLERQYNTLDGVSYSSSLYDLCYKCHNETSLLADQSFSKHKKHFQEKDTSCSVCHDPHGIDTTQGNPTNNSNLINFDINSVFEDPVTGRLEFEDLGRFTGRCYLSCHGKNHSPLEY